MDTLKRHLSVSLLMCLALVWSCTKSKKNDEADLQNEDIKILAVDEQQESLDTQFKSYYLGDLESYRLCLYTEGQEGCGSEWIDAPKENPFVVSLMVEAAGNHVVLIEGRFASGNILQDQVSFAAVDAGNGGGQGNQNGGTTSGNGETNPGTTTGGTTPGTTPGGTTTGEQSSTPVEPPPVEVIVQNGGGEEATPSADGEVVTPTQGGEVISNAGPQTEPTTNPTPQEAPKVEAGIYQHGKLAAFEADQYIVKDDEIRLKISLPEGVVFDTVRISLPNQSVALCQAAFEHECNPQFAGEFEALLNRDLIPKEDATTLVVHFSLTGDDNTYSFELKLFMDATPPTGPKHNQLVLKENEEGALGFHWFPEWSSTGTPSTASYVFKSCGDTLCQQCGDTSQEISHNQGSFLLTEDQLELPITCVASKDLAGNQSAFTAYIRSYQIQHEELNAHSYINRTPLFSKGMSLPLLQDFTFAHNDGGSSQLSGMRILPNTHNETSKVYVGLYDYPSNVSLNTQVRYAHLSSQENHLNVVEGFCDHKQGCRINLDEMTEDHAFLLSGYEFRLRGLTQQPTGASILESNGIISVNLVTPTNDPFYYKVVYALVPKALVKDHSSRREAVDALGFATYDRSKHFAKSGQGLIRGFNLEFQSADQSIRTVGSVDRLDLAPLMETEKPIIMPEAMEMLAFNLPNPVPPTSISWDRTMTYDATKVTGVPGNGHLFLLLTCDRDDCRCDGTPQIIQDLEQGFEFHNLEAKRPLKACVATAYDTQGFYSSTFQQSDNTYDGLMNLDGEFSGDELILNNLPDVEGNLKVAFFGNENCEGPAYEEEIFTKDQLSTNLIRKRFQTQLLHHDAMVYTCFKVSKPDGESLEWRRVAEPRVIKRQLCTYSGTSQTGEKSCVQNFGQVIERRGKINSIELQGNVCADIYGWGGSLNNTRKIQEIIAQSGDISESNRDFVYWVQMVPCGLSRGEIAGLGYSKPDDLYITYSGWFSEENNGKKSCKADEAMIGLWCKGRYCDDIRLRCAKLRSGATPNQTNSSAWFSEENSLTTQDDKHIAGIACKGRFCDDLKITWKTFNDPRLSKKGQCYDTHAFSEGDDNMPNHALCNYLKGYTVSGIKCHGKFCDNKKLRCCR